MKWKTMTEMEYLENGDSYLGGVSQAYPQLF